MENQKFITIILFIINLFAITFVVLGQTVKNEPCNNTFGLKCANCSYLQFCLGSREIGGQQCSDISKSTPYCSVNVCSSVPTEKCKSDLNQASSSIVCAQSGIFPNTRNCSKFFICPGADKSPTEMSCPSPLIYDSKTNSCKRRIFASDCKTIDCSKSPNKFIIYPKDKSVLAFCEKNTENPILTRCLDYTNEEYDPQTLKCKTVCKNEGQFSDKYSCTKYYQCVRNGYSFIQVQLDCYPFKYNSISGGCELKLNNDPCNPEIATPSTTLSTSEKTPTSTENNPTSTEKNPTSPEKIPTSPEKNPTSPEKNPTSPEKNPTSPEKNPTSPEKNPTSPEKNPTP